MFAIIGITFKLLPLVEGEIVWLAIDPANFTYRQRKLLAFSEVVSRAWLWFHLNYFCQIVYFIIWKEIIELLSFVYDKLSNSALICTYEIVGCMHVIDGMLTI